jgi:2-iminobutanoate/2-iminopropanoate deaminase
MGVKAFITNKAPERVGPYSHAVRAGGFVFTCGQGPRDPQTNEVSEDIEAQIRQAFENLRAVLEAAGASLDGVVKVNVYLANLEDRSMLNRIFKEYFRSDAPPARVTLEARLGKMGVEVDAIAWVGP